MLQAVLGADEQKVAETIYAFYCALIGNAALSEDSYKAAQKGARDVCNTLLNSLRPWDKRTTAQNAAAERDAIAEEYRLKCGDLSDTEFQKKVLHDVEMLKARGAAAEAKHADLKKRFEAKTKGRRARPREKPGVATAR